MGLSKSIIQRNGAPAEYHKITGIRVYKGGFYEVDIQSFYTKEARDNGMPPVDVQTKFITDKDLIDRLIASQYKIIKTVPEFSDSIDILEPVIESQLDMESK